MRLGTFEGISATTNNSRPSLTMPYTFALPHPRFLQRNSCEAGLSILNNIRLVTVVNPSDVRPWPRSCLQRPCLTMYYSSVAQQNRDKSRANYPLKLFICTHLILSIKYRYRLCVYFRNVLRRTANIEQQFDSEFQKPANRNNVNTTIRP